MLSVHAYLLAILAIANATLVEEFSCGRYLDVRGRFKNCLEEAGVSDFLDMLGTGDIVEDEEYLTELTALCSNLEAKARIEYCVERIVTDCPILQEIVRATVENKISFFFDSNQPSSTAREGCGSFPIIDNGKAKLVDGSSEVGSKATVTCDPGYETKKKLIKCQKSGKWEIPQCKKIDCGPVPDIDYGNAVSMDGSTSVGATCAVTCNPGYDTDEDIIECRMSGKWDNTKCKEKQDFDLRLPTAFSPLLYTVELKPDIYQDEWDNFTFTGSVKILLQCLENTNTITLHIKLLNLTGYIYVTPEGKAENLYKGHEFDETRQFVNIYTHRQLTAGQKYTIEITMFIGYLKNDYKGLYLDSYVRGNKTNYLVVSQFEPKDARKAFPCLDEPAMKAQFDITLVRKGIMTSLSNMPLSESVDRGDGWIADKFERTPKMSTYILAFIISNFEYLEKTTTTGIEFRTWSMPLKLNQTQYALDIGAQMMTFFEDYFTIPYPLPKEDMIAFKGFRWSGMENWGLITYRESVMLYNPGQSSEKSKQRTAEVVSHELAHMWFGNLVSPAWWDDLWLNEGFATYYEYLGVDNVHPDWKMSEQFMRNTLQVAMRVDGKATSRPLVAPVTTMSELGNIFSYLVYSKGAALIRMLKFVLGDRPFKTGMINYLRKRQYDVASSDDLWLELSEEARKTRNRITDIKGFMDTWILQMNYPVLDITFNETGRIMVTQRRYLNDPSAADPGKYISPYGYKWNIPFLYTTSVIPRFDLTNDYITLMDKESDNVTIITDGGNIPEPTGNNWVLGNPMQYGFYRVNYDDRNWNALAEQLNSDHTLFPVINRAQLIDDAWNLYRSGDINLRISLRTTEYLKKEKEWLPWSTVKYQLKSIGTRLENHVWVDEQYRKFMRNKTSDIFEELTLNATQVNHVESFLQTIISKFACYYGVPACVDEAKQLFADWRDENKRIDQNLRETVYCTSIAEGSAEDWDFVLEQFNKAEITRERNLILRALACSTNTSNINRFLEMATNPNGTLAEYLSRVVKSISKYPFGRLQAWNYLVTNNFTSLLQDRFSLQMKEVVKVLKYVTDGFDKQEELKQVTAMKFEQFLFNTGRIVIQVEEFSDEVKSYFEQYPELKEAFDQVKEKIQGKMDWLAVNLPVVHTWLDDQGY